MITHINGTTNTKNAIGKTIFRANTKFSLGFSGAVVFYVGVDVVLAISISVQF